jgi:hypothetical protein
MATEGSSGRRLERAHRRWILINAVLIAAFVNAALSALIAWLSAAGEDNVPLWSAPLVGGPSTAIDTVGTFFVLPFLTTLVITTVVWAEMRDERLPPLSDPFPWAERLPATRLRRAAVIGLICMAILGPPAAAVVAALDFGDISVGTFVLYKAIFGVVLGVIVTPPIAMLAMSRVPPGADAGSQPRDTPA